MKTTTSKIIIGALVLSTVFACKKGEKFETANSAEIAMTTDSAAATSEKISSAATTNVKDKQFIKTASVDMEVKEVYEATIFIEKSVKDLSGFVTKSQLHSNVVSAETFNTSDEKAMLVKKFQTENTMEVRVPTENLGDFLQLINDKKLFLNSRIINAEDVTANIKYAELEAKRIDKTGENISTLKNTDKKVDKADDNMVEKNQQQLQTMNIADNLKYSTINIFIKEPQLRIAEIAVTNSKNVDNQYKFNFFYDAKNAFVEGFYLIQTILVVLIKIWPLLLIGFGIFFFIKKKKITINKANPNISDT
mgnify:CR=1 FL=1